MRSKFADNSQIASLVPSAMEKPSCAANLTARIIRKASSKNLSLASPTQRTTPCFKSLTPSNASTNPFVLWYAMAFIVKSLRFKSSMRFGVNVTSFGCRESSYAPSIRYVVTSNPSRPIRTVTVPCCIPVSMVLEKSAFTSFGIAEVVMSQSLGFLPKILSRMQPPTAYAS